MRMRMNHDSYIQKGDCLELMKNIPDGSVDMILADPPYKMTSAKFDTNIIPFDKTWEQYERVIKDNGAIVIFSKQPFTTDLINSNRKLFRYELIWKKTMATNPFMAKIKPMSIHENILVFYRKRPTYNPQMWFRDTPDLGRIKTCNLDNHRKDVTINVSTKKCEYHDTGWRYPLDVITFSNWNQGGSWGKERKYKHPTQKPVDLLEWLIKTYTDPGELVLDNCMGSGSTCVACMNTHRRFIGFELDDDYYEIANNRLDDTFYCR